MPLHFENFLLRLVVVMHTSFMVITLLAAFTMAEKLAFTNADSFGAMLRRGDTILKRQGYTPDTISCGRGDTCVEACGADSVQCPSKDTSQLYCHSSTDGSVRINRSTSLVALH